MLGENGNVGIKTGNNDGNKGAFLFASKQMVDGKEITIVGTIMGGPDLSTVLRDSGPLTLGAFAGFNTTSFVKSGQTIGTYNVPGQGVITAVAAADLQFPTWNGAGFNGSASLQPLKGAAVASKSVGSVTAHNMKTNVMSSVPVNLSAAVNKPSLTWRLTHPLGH